MTMHLLEGVRVIELSLIIPGNQTGSLLADLGADVIKVEPPPFGDYIREVYPVDREKRISAMDLLLNRNKRSVTLDLRHDGAREAFYELVRSADIVFDLSLPGTRERLGVGYEDCKRVKPEIIYCTLTGFGYTGPYSMIPAHGYGPQAIVGDVPVYPDGKGGYTMDQPGNGGAPAGPLYAALAMVAALAHRSRTGEGCFMETSMVDGAAQSHALETYRALNPRHPHMPMEVGAGSFRYKPYECSDGKLIMFCPLEFKFWQRFCEAVEREDLLERDGWSGQVMDFGREDAELEQELMALFLTKPQVYWVEVLGRQARIPCTPAYTFQELLQDEEYVQARQMTVTYYEPRLADNITLPAFPVKRPGIPYRVERPSPQPGEHNQEVLGELGYDEVSISGLYESGALFTARAPGKD